MSIARMPTSRMPSRRRWLGCPGAGRLAVFLLVALLAWAGGWAAWHRVAHGGPHLAQARASAEAATPLPAVLGWHGDPIGHQPGGADCQVLDHGLSADAPPAWAAPWLPGAPVAQAPWPPRPERVGLRPRWAQPARAPPQA